MRRRSTETSGGLDYYWSSVAGVGQGSSTSSLVVSPSPSFTNLPNDSRPALNLARMRSKSSVDLRKSSSSPYPAEIVPPPNSSVKSDQYPPQSLQRPSIQTREGAVGDEPIESPGGFSDRSEYSIRDSGPSSSTRPMPSRADTLDAYYASYANQISGSPESSTSKWIRGHQSKESASTVRARPTGFGPGFSPNAQEDSDFSTDAHHTPIAPLYQDTHDLKTPQMAHEISQFVRQPSPTHSQNSIGQTPTRTTTGASPSASSYTPGSGRQQRFYPSPSSQGSQSPALSTPSRSPAPQSAPAAKTEFGFDGSMIRDEQEEEDRGKNRTTLSHSVDSSNGLLSPDRDLHTPERPLSDERESSQSPIKSPEPPPRSTLRNQYVQSHTANGLC